MFKSISEFLATTRDRFSVVFTPKGNSSAPFYRQAEIESKHWSGNWISRIYPYYLYEDVSNNFIYFSALDDFSNFVSDITISYFHADCDPQEVDNALKTLKSKNNLWFTFSRSDGFQLIGPIK